MNRKKKIFSQEELKILDKKPVGKKQGLSEYLKELLSFKKKPAGVSVSHGNLDVDGRGQFYYNALREYLSHLAEKEYSKPHIIAVTSCNLGEGVTTVATNFAVTLARHNDGRILLADANIIKPECHKIFQVNRTPGLVGIVQEGIDCVSAIQKTSENNLYILPSGRKKRRAEELNDFFEKKEFKDLLEYVENEFDYVIFDALPFRDGNFAAQIGQDIDGVIIVVETEKVRWQVVKRAQNQLNHFNANILGVVLNKRRFHIPRWVYDKL